MADIEPALVAGDIFRDHDGEQVLGIEDDHAALDGPQERLADAAGITLAQAAAALDWMRHEAREAAFEEAAALAGMMFAALLPRDCEKIRLDLLGIRALACRVILNRGGTATLTDWAARAGISKQLLSHHVRDLEDRAHAKWIGGKRTATREVFSEATRARWALLTPEERRARRRGKAAAPADGQATSNEQI